MIHDDVQAPQTKAFKELFLSHYYLYKYVSNMRLNYIVFYFENYIYDSLVSVRDF